MQKEVNPSLPILNSQYVQVHHGEKRLITSLVHSCFLRIHMEMIVLVFFFLQSCFKCGVKRAMRLLKRRTVSRHSNSDSLNDRDRCFPLI